MLDEPKYLIDWVEVAIFAGVLALGWCAGLAVWSLLAKGGKLLVARRS